jgi:hypothetical protein
VLFPALLLLLGASLAIGYQSRVVSQIPVYMEWNRQHLVLTPEPARLILSYGLLLPLALTGVRPFFRKQPELAFLFAFFAIFSWLFSHFPIQFQERFLEGSPLSVSIFAGFGLLEILNRFKTTALQIALGICVIGLLIPSDAVAMYTDVAVLRTGKPPQYLPRELLAAMKELRTLVPAGEPVLSAQSSGNFIPAYSGRQVVLGHQVQTAGYLQKLQLVTTIFHTSAPAGNSEYLLRLSRARWLFWGPEERYVASDLFDPEKSPFCERKFSNRLARIYRLHFD